MIIAKEKYKDGYIIYIDESKGLKMLECFQNYFDSLAEEIRKASAIMERENVRLLSSAVED
jgi:hypothetical protein